jgi:hypothetical protein
MIKHLLLLAIVLGNTAGAVSITGEEQAPSLVVVNATGKETKFTPAEMGKLPRKKIQA